MVRIFPGKRCSPSTPKSSLMPAAPNAQLARRQQPRAAVAQHLHVYGSQMRAAAPPAGEFSPQPQRVPHSLRLPRACARSPVCSRGTWRCTGLSALPSPFAPCCRAGRTRERLRGSGHAAYGAGAARMGGQRGAGREPARGRTSRPCARRGCGCATRSGSECCSAPSGSPCLRP